MKVIASCLRCKEKNPNENHFFEGHIDNHLVLTLDCPEGHQATCTNQKFELFFDAATRDLLNKNYESTILFSHAAYESHILFLLIALLRGKGDKDEVTKIRNTIQANSVKALGAFLALFIFSVGKSPVFLKEDMYKLRNSIIHKGDMASEKEAANYHKTVYEAIKFNQSEVRKIIDKEEYANTQFHNYIRGVTKTKTGTLDCLNLGSPFSEEEIVSYDEYMKVYNKHI